MIKLLIATLWPKLCDLFPVYMEPLDVGIPPDMEHLLGKLGGGELSDAYLDALQRDIDSKLGPLDFRTVRSAGGR